MSENAFMFGKPNDRFMYDTVRSIVVETVSVEDKPLIDEVYEELYKSTDAVGKSWNCGMIDKLILEML